MTLEGLLREFHVAFPPDPPPTAREVTEPFVLCQEGYDLFPLLAGRRWTEVALRWPDAQDAAYHLLDPAFAYYLPAMLTPVLRDPESAEARDVIGETLGHFAPRWFTLGGWREPPRTLRMREIATFEARFSGLTALQREAVARFLAWTVDQSRQDEEFPSIFEADRLEFWPLPGSQS